MFLIRLAAISIVLLLTVDYNCVTCSECNDGDYTHDPHDCNAFFQCSFGEFIRRRCPANLHFNRRQFVCDFPDRAGCILEPTEPPPTITSNTTYTTHVLYSLII